MGCRAVCTRPTDFSGFLLPQPQFSSENNGKAVSQSVVEEFAAVYEKPTYLFLACLFRMIQLLLGFEGA